MKKLVWVLAGALIIIFTPVISVRAEVTKRGLLIGEIQTGSSVSASEEFIELYNQSEETLDLSQYKLEYFSASSLNFSSPSRIIALGGTLYPSGRYLVASTGYLSAQANTAFGATLAKTGGHIRLVSTTDSQTIVHDLVGWGSASMPETAAAQVPDSGESLQRKVTGEGTYQDTDDNSQDFFLNISPTPESSNPQPPIIEDPTPPDPAPDPVEETPVPTDPEPIPDEPEPTAPLLPLQITELLPNPGSPQTDADDEFIEIFNPNNEPVNLENYRLETGNDFGYHYTFGSIVVGQQQYVVMKSKDTNLVLSNSGSRARLLDSGGTVLSETSAYDAADENTSWALVGATWQWTITPTPGQTNIVSVSVPVTAVTASKPKKPAASAKPKAKKPASAKVASAKAAKPKTSAKAKKAANDTIASGSKPGVASSIHPGILAAIGVIALGYAAYEYRTDIANRFHQLRSNRKNSPGSGQST